MTAVLLVLGAGGHGRAVAEAALLGKQWKEVLFLDDAFPAISKALNCPVVGRIADLPSLAHRCDGAIAAVGNNVLREEWVSAVEASSIPLVSVVHPEAWVSPTASVGPGSAVMAGAVVGTCSSLGRGVIVNANATVDHDAQLLDFAHLGVGVHLAGGVVVGQAAWLQAGTCAGYGVVIGTGVNSLPGQAFLVREDPN